MMYLLAGGFLLALGLIMGFFLVDRNSLESVNTTNGVKSHKAKEDKREISIDLSGDIVSKLNQYIAEGNDVLIDEVIDQLEQFPQDRQLIIIEAVSQPAVRERYKSGLTDTNYKKRAASAERLGKIGGEGAVGLLFNAMADRNEEVRLAATASLKKIKDSSVASMLIESLKFPNKWLPARVAEVLLSLGEVSVTALEGALSDDDPVIRGYVIELLGEMGAGVSAHTLYPALKDENSNVRLQAARVLGKIGDADATKVLAELFNDQETKVRIQAVRSIGKIGGQYAARQLEKLLTSEEDPRIQIAAFDTLKLMGGEGLRVVQSIALTEGHSLQQRAREIVLNGGEIV